MTIHCAVCVNTTKPPWPKGTHTHTGYQLCDSHAEQLNHLPSNSTILDSLYHAGWKGNLTVNASIEAT